MQLHAALIAELLPHVNSMLVAELIAPLHLAMVSKKNTVSDEDLKTRDNESAALRRLWADRHPRLSQAEFAHEYHLGSQGNVGHYLHGRQTLTAEAAQAFAAFLRRPIEAFSPRLAEQIKRQKSLVEWPFKHIDPDQWNSLPPGLRLKLEGELLERIPPTEGERARRPPRA